MNKNTRSISRTKKPQAKDAKSKTTKPQAKVAKGKTMKKVSTTKNKEPSDLPIKQVVKRRASTAAVVKDKEQVAKRTQRVKTEEPSDFLSDDFLSDDLPIKQVAKRKVSTDLRVKTKEPVDEAEKLKREQHLEKLRQYYQADREIVCKKQKTQNPDRMKRVKNDPLQGVMHHMVLGPHHLQSKKGQ